MGRDFKNLQIWQLSYQFVLDCYRLLNKLPENEERNIKDQLRRAATSITLNIAEGCSYRSNKAFLNHLNYAYGSAKECDVLLLLCKDLKYISYDEFHQIAAALDKLKSFLYRFMLSVQKEILHNQSNYSLNKDLVVQISK
ncbi:TPA: four helix bundle protein [Candidatus Woesearchaeota archaeon]|nr:four helix bundle protein [Candidatus Woesearchaeota archaeon]